MDGITCNQGITLNSQIVDLLSILDTDLSAEDQNKAIENYIENLRSQADMHDSSIQNGTRIEFLVNKIIDESEHIPSSQKIFLKQLYIESFKNLDICDTEKMKETLSKNNLTPSLHEEIIKASGNLNVRAKAGILDLTPEKVRNLYAHLFGDGSECRYDRATIDEAGKFSGYVGIDSKTFTPQKLDKIMEFCQKHGMKTKINALVFYDDFPKMYESYLDKKVKSDEISEGDKKILIKKSLLDYVKAISERYGKNIDCVDIFNELIYDPDMKEPGFDEEASYHVRTEGWQKYLSLEDLCDIALEARKQMPNVTFTYNDVNWENPEKRKQIINIVKEIQAIESRYRAEGKLSQNEKGLIDTIGVEAHLGTDTILQDIEDAISDIETQIGLPIEITELDISRYGKDPLSEEEIRKQNDIVQKIIELSVDHRISFLTAWTLSDELAFMNNKCGHNVYSSVILDSNCLEKKFTYVCELGTSCSIREIISNALISEDSLVTTSSLNSMDNILTNLESSPHEITSEAEQDSQK